MSSKITFFQTKPLLSTQLFNNEEFIHWLKLLPAITFITAGSTYIPHFAYGCIMATGLFIVNFILNTVMDTFAKPEKYEEFIELTELTTSLLAPIHEELLYRGLILQLFIELIKSNYPSALESCFLETDLSIADAIAIFTTALLFGFMHTFNVKTNGFTLMPAAFLGGLMLGFLTKQYGLLIAIGAHSTNNTIAVLLYSLKTKQETKSIENELTKPIIG